MFDKRHFCCQVHIFVDNSKTKQFWAFSKETKKFDQKGNHKEKPKLLHYTKEIKHKYIKCKISVLFGCLLIIKDKQSLLCSKMITSNDCFLYISNN